MDEGQRRVRDACSRIRRGRGLYVWGPAGRGKTMLLDEYFAGVRERKLRMHFHDFFARFHAAFMQSRFDIDLALTLTLGDARVVFFDEFFVHDVGDAMLIHRAVDAMARKRITLVATSNYAPDDLLPSSLFHQKFLPTIELLKSSMQIVCIGDGIDYRTESTHASGFAAGRWVTDRRGEFDAPPGRRVVLTPAGHPVVALAATEDTVWFDFADLCDKPTATADYIALAETYSRWVVLGIPSLADSPTDAAIRFANVVDVLCDRDIEVVMVSGGPPDLAGVEAVPQFESARLASRLSQLQR
ncbi:cell division protein ZapE [Actinomycetes bacterium M1A6_2h]